MSVFTFVVEHFQEILNAVLAILTGVIAVSLIVPGDQPEKALRSVADFLSKFSRKSNE